MSLHASWVHGNAVRPEWVGDKIHQVQGDRWDESHGYIAWSDINGLPRGWGATYRCSDSRNIGLLGAQVAAPFDVEHPFQGVTWKGDWVHFPIPTPVIVSDSRANLLRVFVLWTATGDLIPAAVHVWDGPQRVAALPAGHEQSAETLIAGSTQFDLPAPIAIRFGLSISFGVQCRVDSDVTFHSAGADFDI